MNFAEYQRKSRKFAQYAEPVYPFLALPEETGEFVGLIAKASRGDDMEARFGSREQYQEAVLKEAGDVLWQLTQCLTEMGLSLQDAAELNLKKLEDRLQRGVIKGQGDNR
ncbi:MazG nucleotide pyrophosphohydrolase domain-containing protein [Stutzerimonas stutzeri]|uniref:MazG nucleotide pyrophosphohydrolase domain-containing protein n=1 Tax=Stutzerimonas stutzeri TaxID=316 RepID=UPI00030C7E70|nr:MazG nucleotide pyrophosphohydrolase domain-containing protein [Stutzerimonas stutzeri]